MPSPQQRSTDSRNSGTDTSVATTLGVLQRVIARYRVPVFQALSHQWPGNVSLFGAIPGPNDNVPLPSEGSLGGVWHKTITRRHLFGAFQFFTQPELNVWLSNVKPDVIIVEANPRLASAYSVPTWAHQHGCVVVGWGLGMQLVGKAFRGLRSAWRKKFMSRFDAVIAYSTVAAEQYELAGIPRERIFVAPNATSKAPATLPRRPPRPTNGQITLAFVGKLIPAKRVDQLLSACARLPNSIAPRVVIVGDGPDRERLQDHARSVYPNAEFVGAQYGDDLTALLAASDLFVLPGLGGLAVQEAMAQGLPVIVTRADGTERDLVTADNGWIVEPNEIALAVALSEAISDRTQLEAMGRRSFELVRDKFNVEAMVSQMIAAADYALRSRQTQISA